MGLIQRDGQCTKCKWQGKVQVENIKPQTAFEELGSLIAVGLRSSKCPECGADTIPDTRQMVS